MSDVDELFDTLSYAVRLYEKTNLLLDANDDLYEQDLLMVNKLGFEVDERGRLSDADLDKLGLLLLPKQE